MSKAKISNALQLESRMQAIINQGLQLMSDMQGDNLDTYTLSQVWSNEAVVEMAMSLIIIQQALSDIQTQCPNLASVIFPRQEQEQAVE